MRQQGNLGEQPSNANAWCLCGEEGPRGERCDVCGYNFASFRKPEAPSLSSGGLMPVDYDPLRGWCYCDKTGPVDETCKGCKDQLPNDPKLLMREWIYPRGRWGTLWDSYNISRPIGAIHRRIDDEPERSPMRRPEPFGTRGRSYWPGKHENKFLRFAPEILVGGAATMFLLVLFSVCTGFSIG